MAEKNNTFSENVQMNKTKCWLAQAGQMDQMDPPNPLLYLLPIQDGIGIQSKNDIEDRMLFKWGMPF